MESRWAGYGIAGGVFALDRFTKWMIESNVREWQTHVVIPDVFNIVHTQNRGAAFGLLAESQSEWRSVLLIGLSLVALVLVAGMLWQPAHRFATASGIMRAGLSLILGGALGNIYDRLIHGTVTDFLQVFIGTYEWPAFNVADSAISIGAVLLLLDLWTSRNRAPEAKCSPKS